MKWQHGCNTANDISSRLRPYLRLPVDILRIVRVNLHLSIKTFLEAQNINLILLFFDGKCNLQLYTAVYQSIKINTLIRVQKWYKKPPILTLGAFYFDLKNF